MIISGQQLWDVSQKGKTRGLRQPTLTMGDASYLSCVLLPSVLLEQRRLVGRAILRILQGPRSAFLSEGVKENV